MWTVCLHSQTTSDVRGNRPDETTSTHTLTNAVLLASNSKLDFSLLSFTFDTNCLIDLELDREDAPSILDLIKGHREKRCHAAFVAVSASERQIDDYFLNSFRDFEARLAKLNLDDIPHILGMAYNDISFIDHALIPGGDMIAREMEFHEALFPNISFTSPRNRSTKSTISDEEDRASEREWKRWRNAWCDRQMIWSHEHHNRDVFVTRDGNYNKKLTNRTGFEHLTICSPKVAAAKL